MSLLSNGDGKPMNGGGDDGEHDPHYEPIIYLPEVHIHSNEEEEAILVNLRAKLFRHDNNEKVWKERGTGEVKLLHNVDLNTVRVVMRRDKTLKLCANHYVTVDMELKSNCGSDRAWVWSTQADVADGDPRPEVLAIRFQNSEAAMKWKDKFEEAKSIVAQGPAANDESKDCAVSDESDAGESTDDEVVREVTKLTLASSKTEPSDDKQPTEEEKVDSKDGSPKAEC